MMPMTMTMMPMADDGDGDVDTTETDEGEEPTRIRYTNIIILSFIHSNCSSMLQ